MPPDPKANLVSVPGREQNGNVLLMSSRAVRAELGLLDPVAFRIRDVRNDVCFQDPSEINPNSVNKP